MKVVQVKCPNCQNPILSKGTDMVYYCDNCKTIHTRDGGVHVIDYEIADFAKGAPLENRVYVPFWRVYGSFIINHMENSGGGIFKLANWVRGGGENRQGEIFIFVPAADFDPITFRRLGTMLTVSPPRYASRLDFNLVPRLPAAVSKEEAAEMADFLVVTMEADKPGVLQDLDYTLTINDTRLVYLPFVTSPSGLMPGL